VRWDADCDGKISDREFRNAREYPGEDDAARTWPAN